MPEQTTTEQLTMDRYSLRYLLYLFVSSLSGNTFHILCVFFLFYSP